MNSCNEEFLMRNEIDPRNLMEKVNCRMYDQSEINSIVYDHGFQQNKGLGQVSVADIIGYYSIWGSRSSNIFENLDNLFDSYGDGYHSRSVGMLSYNQDNILEELNRSFTIEPISVCETGEGQYTIFNNGLHRFTVLKILYLKEMAEANGNIEEIERIKNKYTIPAKITGINLEQTYCKYLLRDVMLPDYSIRNIESHYDKNYHNTGNIEFTYSSGEKRVIDTEEFIKLTKDKLKEQLPKDRYISYILQNTMSRYQSFKKFIEDYFNDIITLPKIQEGDEK